MIKTQFASLEMLKVYGSQLLARYKITSGLADQTFRILKLDSECFKKDCMILHEVAFKFWPKILNRQVISNDRSTQRLQAE